MVEKAIDPHSGEEFLKKRNNQKFSCPKNRIKYNNNKALVLRTKLAPYNTELHKSIVTLNELMKGKKEEEFHKQYLLGKGVSFTSFTGGAIYGGKQHFCIYYFIIVPIDNNKIKVIRK